MPSLAELLAAVEAVPREESGAFVVDAGAVHLGSVFVEATHICWAATAGRSGRLRALLLLHAGPGLAPAELDRTLTQCRDEHRPLGELLVRRGLVSEASLREALRQHTVECLIAQCDQPDGQVTWVPHRRRGYHARFAFAPVDLLAAAGASLYASESAGADAARTAVLPMAQAAGSFAIGDDGEAVAVRAAAATTLGVRELVELGAWAAAGLEASHGFSAPVMARAVASATGPAALGWRSGRRLVHAAVIDDPDVLARAVAELGERRLPAVLSSHVPRPDHLASESRFHPTP